jgi:hypothetical protein
MAQNRFLRTPSLGVAFAKKHHSRQKNGLIDMTEWRPLSGTKAQVAELVDALVSGTSGESRGGSSPLLGTKLLFAFVFQTAKPS